MRTSRPNNRGTTLVELIVCMALLGIFCLACSVLIRPCAATFREIQKTARAQMIADTIVEDLRSQLLYAEGTIRFAQDATKENETAPFVAAGGYDVQRGNAIEIQTGSSYFELIDAGYVPVTQNSKTSVEETVLETPIPAGTLHYRYYKKEGNDKYYYNDGTDYLAYGYADAYTKKFYAGDTVELAFSVQGSVWNGTNNEITALRVDVTIKDADDNTLHTQSAILELSNKPVLVQTQDAFAPEIKK